MQTVPLNVNKKLPRELKHIMGTRESPSPHAASLPARQPEEKDHLEDQDPQNQGAPCSPQQRDSEFDKFRVEESAPGLSRPRVYEAPDIPCSGKYMLLIKNSSNVTLFPLSQKVICKQVFLDTSNQDEDEAIKKTNLLMKNRKVRDPDHKKDKKAPKDAKNEEKKSKEESESGRRRSPDSLADLVNNNLGSDDEAEFFSDTVAAAHQNQSRLEKDGLRNAERGSGLDDMLRRKNYQAELSQPAAANQPAPAEFKEEEDFGSGG